MINSRNAILIFIVPIRSHFILLGLKSGLQVRRILVKRWQRLMPVLQRRQIPFQVLLIRSSVDLTLSWLVWSFLKLNLILDWLYLIILFYNSVLLHLPELLFLFGKASIVIVLYSAIWKIRAFKIISFNHRAIVRIASLK